LSNAGFIHEMRAGDSIVIAAPAGEVSDRIGPTPENVTITLMHKSGSRARVKVVAPAAIEVAVRKDRSQNMDKGAKPGT
jgi:hypothetical protein